MAELKLQALDAEDLAVLSAQCQDAIVRVGDMAFERAARRFAMVANRFDWASAAATPAQAAYQRRRAGLRFETVSHVKVSGIDLRQVDRALVLLAIQCQGEPGSPTTITLQFADGAAIRLDVESIEVELKDLGGVWSTRSKPDHSSSQPAALPASPAPKPIKP